LSTRRLLTMTWLDGRAIQARIDEDPPAEERAAYARALFRAWYVPLYGYGVIHGDPHLGNYQVRSDMPENGGWGINLLDFGVVRIFPPSFIGGVIMLFEAIRDGDFDKAAEAYRKAVKLDPESVSANYNLGSSLARSGKFTEAESHLRAAIETDPKHAAAHQALAQVLESLGRTDEARRETEAAKALEVAP